MESFGSNRLSLRSRFSENKSRLKDEGRYIRWLNIGKDYCGFRILRGIFDIYIE